MQLIMLRAFFLLCETSGIECWESQFFAEDNGVFCNFKILHLKLNLNLR